MEILKSQTGFSIASVIFSMLILGMIGVTMAPLVGQEGSKSVLENHGQMAFYVADGGLQSLIADQFYGDTDFSDNVSPTGVPFGGASITLGEGEFWAEYNNLSVISADVTVTGRVEQSVRRIAVNVSKGPAGGNGINAGNNCNMRSSQGGGGSISGDITCGTTPNVDGGYTVTGTIGTGPAPPPVNLQPLINLTTNTVNGNLTISGNYAGNVRVTGNVTIRNPGTITGIIVADGSVTIDVKQSEDRDLNGTIAAAGNIVIDYKQQSTGSLFAQQAGGILQPLIIAGQDITMRFHQDTLVDFHGLIQAGRDVRLELRQRDAVVVEGAIVAGGDIEIDAKQNTNINVDSGGGQPFLGGNLILSQWQEV